jgi:hypothetical protein
LPAGPVILDEVVLVGKHPDHDYLEVVVVGSNGSDTAWQAALEYVGVFLSAAAAKGIKDPGAVLVDVKNDNVRAAKALRRMR